MWIDSVDDYNHRIILTKRYINFEHWKKIASDLTYSWHGIHRVHHEALEYLVKQNRAHNFTIKV